MKKISLFNISLVLAAASMATACSEFKPDTPELPELAPVSNLQVTPVGLSMELTWNAPAGNVSGYQITIDGNNDAPQFAEASATSYTVKGRPMGQEQMYTVKAMYAGNYVSEGVSVLGTLPQQTLPQPTNVQTSVSNRTVTVSWTLPAQTPGYDITGINVLCNGVTAMSVPADYTTATLKGQQMGEPLEYGVQLVYDGFYSTTPQGTALSQPLTIEPYPTKMAYVLTAATWTELPDDDEMAAAYWFSQQTDQDPVFIQVSDIASLDPEEVSVVWIMIDRVGLEQGWQNLPGGLGEQSTIDALLNYSANGGSIYLSKMAVQLVEPLGMVPAGMGPNIYANGTGGDHGDIWTINPYLGWVYQPNGSQKEGFYDRTDHEIYKGLTLEQVNDYPYPSLPLLGPGQMEDHNIMWDLNVNPPFGKGNMSDVIANFESTVNCLVLATWGHVRDHCVAGLVLFNANPQHGRCVANGFAAYEFAMNNGENPYQANINGLTLNILTYLK